MTGPHTTAEPIGRPLHGAMRDLTPQERRDWQQTTLAIPPRDYGWEARLQFWLEDVVFGKARTLPKFWARELIARSPYLSWEQAAYLSAGKLRDHSALAGASTTGWRKPGPSRTTSCGTCSSSRR